MIGRITRSSVSSIDHQNARAVSPPPVVRRPGLSSSKRHVKQQSMMQTVAPPKRKHPGGRTSTSKNAHRSFRPAEFSEESGDEAHPPQKRPKAVRHKSETGTVLKAIEQREYEEEVELEADDQMEYDMDMADERLEDQEAAQYLDFEAPHIVEAGTLSDNEFVRVPHPRSHSRSSSQASFASSLGPTPPATDFNDYDYPTFPGQDEDLEEEEPTLRNPSMRGKGKQRVIIQEPEEYEASSVSSSYIPTKGHSRKSQQLQYELPEVGAQGLPTSRTVKTPISSPSALEAPPVVPSSAREPPTPAPMASTSTLSVSASSASTPTVPALVPLPTPTTIPIPAPATTGGNVWLPRTEIRLSARGRTFVTAITGQNEDMKRVLEGGIKIGKHYMLLKDTFCPVGAEIKSLAFTAVRDSAEKLGFNGPGDVVQRLNCGDQAKYVKPIADYVAHRVGLERKDLKNLQAATVIAAYSLNELPNGQQEASALVLTRNYIYPKTENGYDYQRPFEHPAFHQYMKAMFFGTTPYSNIIQKHKDVFMSVAAHKDKPELPISLIALSTVAIHAILQDYAKGMKEDFPSKELDGVWRTAIDILINIKTVNVSRYHKLLHTLYMQSSGTLTLATHGMSNQQIFDTVDWSALAKDEDGTAGGHGIATITESTTTTAPPITASPVMATGSPVPGNVAPLNDVASSI